LTVNGEPQTLILTLEGTVIGSLNGVGKDALTELDASDSIPALTKLTIAIVIATGDR
jgi:hypothetical protein